jgi:uroporphyrinogen decarboxylase
MLKHLPVRNPRPDAATFVAGIMGRDQSGGTRLVEYIVDDMVMRPVVTELLGREWIGAVTDRASLDAHLDNVIAFWAGMGYDFVRLEIGMNFQHRTMQTADTAPGSVKMRGWADEHAGAIMCWEDFERFTWPCATDVDLYVLEYINNHLPDGMGLITSHGGGIFEHLSRVMSLEGLCLALHDAPDLVAAVARKVGEAQESYYERLLQLDRLIVIFPGDDMGFRSGTLIGPDAMRKYCLPWHKRYAEMTHAKDLPYWLHSCGNLAAIYEDLIEDVHIDAKHSFEDVIMPVQDFHARYSDRIGVLGGMDLNILSGGSPKDVRAHTRFLSETCGARGRYAIGSGNSVPSYVPPENYLAMIDQALDMRG